MVKAEVINRAEAIDMLESVDRVEAVDGMEVLIEEVEGEKVREQKLLKV